MLRCALNRGHSGGSRGHCYGSAEGHRTGHGLSKRTHEHKAWSWASLLQYPRTPELILSPYPQSRNLDLGVSSLEETESHTPTAAEDRGVQILDLCQTWGNDRL